MNSARQVENQITNWKAMGLSTAELAVKTAEAALSWPYVWGGAGQYCTPTNRRSYANRSTCPEAEAKVILAKCPVCSGKQGSCAPCRWYPSAAVRFFDCRGFTRWVLAQAGISLQGAGATSQWNTAGNWQQKGPIAEMPKGVVCCVFMQNPKDRKTMEHTGLHIGNGQIIHCSGEVKRGKTTDRGWTHYAIPKGMPWEAPVKPEPEKPEEKPDPTETALLRRGSRGGEVRALQQLLLQKGYDLGPCGADGIFGARTQAAVKAFQKDSGIKADGIVGPVTRGTLGTTLFVP